MRPDLQRVNYGRFGHARTQGEPAPSLLIGLIFCLHLAQVLAEGQHLFTQGPSCPLFTAGYMATQWWATVLPCDLPGQGQGVLAGQHPRDGCISMTRGKERRSWL